MRMLILGRGKTGHLVATVARERGHSIHVLGHAENHDAAWLTPPSLASFDVIIDFTTPEAAVKNVRAALLAGAKIVVGTTGWYDKLDDMCALAERRGGALLHSANFSFGVQLLFRVAQLLGTEAGSFNFHIAETHHTAKLDAPSGTALAMERVLHATPHGRAVTIESQREADAIGTHRLELRSAEERLTIEHQALSRRSFAEGAVRSAEWIASKTGCFNFQDVFPEVLA
jgi:4-hydroxy-tetrahydrodipicolinate reductase